MCVEFVSARPNDTSNLQRPALGKLRDSNALGPWV